MKRNLLFILITFGSLQISIAQVIQGTSSSGNGGLSGDMAFGAKVGLGVSTDLFRNYENISNRPTFFLGGLAEIPAFFENFYLQPEVVLQLTTAKIGEENLTSWYLQLPIMGKYHITDDFAVEFGPQVGFLIADNWNQNVSMVEFQKVGVSLIAGGGYRLNENFYFNLRVGSILSRANNTGNFSFQISANYFF